MSLSKTHLVTIVIVALLLICGAFLVGQLVGCSDSTPGDTAQAESVLERVKRTGRIRAAYTLVEPAVMKDPNTGEISGIFVETLEEIGRRLSVRVDFTEEVGWDQMIPGLQANRYDVVCTQVWPSAPRAREAIFSSPLYYVGVGVWVRADDHRFDDDLQKLNSEEYAIAFLDGTTGDIIARTDFPLARRVSLPGLADPTQQLLEVAQGRADAGFTHTALGNAFIRANPGTLRNAAAARPIRVSPNTFMLKQGEFDFQQMLNTAIEELINSDFVGRLIAQHAAPGDVFAVAPPYQSN